MRRATRRVALTKQIVMKTDFVITKNWSLLLLLSPAAVPVLTG